ncbi:FG-GAP-like repeat-containing protein [Spirosoma pomorum]
MKKLFTFFACLLAGSIQAQISFQYNQQPTVTVNGRALLNPWAGGFNATQYATTRLNSDNRDDLVVFDRISSKITTFIAIDNPSGSGMAWQYAPEYELLFPEVYNWIILVDYDGDGRKDLFTHGSGSIRLFRNELQNGQTSFRSVADPLITEGFSSRLPVYANSADIPAILDFDDDGDVDILAFDPTGNQIAYNQNMSIERAGQKGLDFKRVGGTCWGHFHKEFCNDFTFGVQCETGVGLVDPKPSIPNARPLHSGNTITVIDTDGDGKKDMLFGFVTCANIARLKNGGTNDVNANFVSFDSLYPAQNPILFPEFPSTSWEDVDGDGKKDLLASPNVSDVSNQAFDFTKSGWYYKNVGTNEKPNFQLAQKDFLQNDMIDLGTNTAPALADLDGDGDMDMLVGHMGVQTSSGFRASLYYYENRGTTQNPAFALITTDYLNLQSLGLTSLVPDFADVDNNGSLDLLLKGTGGTDKLILRVFLNGAARGAAVQYDLSKANTWSLPKEILAGNLITFADIDLDGKVDMLVSTDNYGSVSYYRNTGSASSPAFQLQTQAFAGFSIGTAYLGLRSLVVADLNGDQKRELISATGNGQVRVYQLPDQPAQKAVLLDSLKGVPGESLIASVGDLDGDQLPDLMLGNVGGGLRYLKNTSQKVIVTGTPEEATSPWAYPNPTDRFLTVRPTYAGRVELLSLSGQVIVSEQSVPANVETTLDLGSLADGTYLLKLTGDNRPTLVQKVVVWK